MLCSSFHLFGKSHIQVPNALDDQQETKAVIFRAIVHPDSQLY